MFDVVLFMQASRAKEHIDEYEEEEDSRNRNRENEEEEKWNEAADEKGNSTDMQTHIYT